MPAFKKVKPNGRPPKLNDELIEKICNVLRIGAYVETAVVVNGVSKQLFYTWCKLAHKKPGSIYKRFLDAVEKAMEESTIRDLLVIDAAAQGEPGEFLRDDDGKIVYTARGNPIMKKQSIARDWSAAAWRLERRRSKEWSKTEKIETTGKDGKAIESVQVVLTMPSNGREAPKENAED